MNDVDGKFVEWLRENQGSSTMTEFLQSTFFLSENDIAKLEKKEKKPKKKEKKRKK